MLFAAMHLRKHKSVIHFDYQQIQDFYEQLRWKLPANMSDVLGRAADEKKLYIAEFADDPDTGRKLWVVTKTG